jgi:hypothetical protein
MKFKLVSDFNQEDFEKKVNELLEQNYQIDKVDTLWVPQELEYSGGVMYYASLVQYSDDSDFELEELNYEKMQEKISEAEDE